MTKEEINKLSGRDLDVAIHRLLGKKCRFVKSEPSITVEDSSAPLGIRSNFGGAEYTSEGEWLVDEWLCEDTNAEMPHYSRDGGLMLEVLARVSEIGWCYHLSSGNDFRATLFIRGSPPPGQSGTHVGIGSSLPEAVARACLLCANWR